MSKKRLNWKNIGLLASWVLMLPAILLTVHTGRLAFMWVLVWCVYRRGDLFWKGD